MISSMYQSLLEQASNVPIEYWVVTVTTILVLGVSFLFHPAITVYFHEELEHTTTILRQPTQHQQQPQQTSDSSAGDEVLLSLVIPAYNEENRLTVMLEEAFDYLQDHCCPALQTLQSAYEAARPSTQSSAQKSRPPVVEWLVVNDGSSDRTCQVFQRYCQSHSDSRFLWKLVSLPMNSGKGAAVHVGMTEATGYYRLMVDADGATTFGKGLEEVAKGMLLGQQQQQQQGKHDDNNIKNNMNNYKQRTIVFGSRSGGDVQRTLVRSLLMYAFLFLRWCVVGTPAELRDTQCGFKLFDRDCAMALFSNLHLRRWAFDIELVFVAIAMGMTIREVTVPWHEVDGSKLNTGFGALVRVSIQMLRDMMCVRACYVLGIWKIRR